MRSELVAPKESKDIYINPEEQIKITGVESFFNISNHPIRYSGSQITDTNFGRVCKGEETILFLEATDIYIYSPSAGTKLNVAGEGAV